MNGMIKSLSLVRIYFDINNRAFAWIVVMERLTGIMLFINDLHPTSQYIFTFNSSLNEAIAIPRCVFGSNDCLGSDSLVFTGSIFSAATHLFKITNTSMYFYSVHSSSLKAVSK